MEQDISLGSSGIKYILVLYYIHKTAIFTDKIRRETFWHYIRRVVNSMTIMQKLRKIGKPTLVIVALLLLNIGAFSILSTGIKQNQEDVAQISTTTESNTYFKSGVDVLSWSYTLLKYLRQ